MTAHRERSPSRRLSSNVLVRQGTSVDDGDSDSSDESQSLGETFIYTRQVEKVGVFNPHLHNFTVYTRLQVERVYKSNPISEAKNTFFRKSLLF